MNDIYTKSIVNKISDPKNNSLIEINIARCTE